MPENPWTLLGLTPTYEIDGATLRRAWLSRTAALHPDRPDAPPDAAERLSALNRAKSILENPEERASALLTVLGGPGKEQDKSLPQGILMEMLEVREQMEEETGAEGSAARHGWEAWAMERRRAHQSRVSALFKEPPTEQSLGAIRRELNAWRYIERMIEQLDHGSAGSSM